MSDHQAGAGPQQPPQTLNVAGQTVRLQQVLTAAGTRGQQFVITSQVSVPGLTQVIPTIATTNAALQQAGVTRILNIAPSPRVNVVGVSQVPGRGGTLQLATTNTAGNNGTGESPGRGTVSLVAIGQPTGVNASSHPTLVSSLSSPPRQRTAGGAIGIVQSPPPTLVLTSTPNLVRTSSGTFAAPLSSAANLVTSPQTSAPARKRMRLSELQERAPPNEEIGALRRKVIEHKMTKMRIERERYAEHALELFFLQAGGNMMDYHTWRKRPFPPQFLHFLRSHRLDPDDDDEDLTLSLTTTQTPTTQSAEIKITGVGATPVAISTTLPPAVAQLNQQGQIPGRPQGGRHGMVFGLRPSHTTTCIGTSTITAVPLVPGGTPLVLEHASPSSSVNSVGRMPPATSVSSPEKNLTPSTSPTKLNKSPLVSPMARQHTRQHSISAVYDTSIGSQEQIAEKAKQEAYVMQRITELQREGLWSERRLPKVQEPPRVKAHWDYLLEEMIWLAADFAQERKWKKAAAKKCARNVQKYFQEKAVQAQKAEKVQELRLKKIAGFIAKEVKTFWSNVEKLVEYKQQTRLEEKRKKALDQHLSFIVDQTEKYSTWLAQSMNKSGADSGNPSVPPSVNSSRISSPTRQMSDDEFQPNQSSTDDEETIAKAEEDMGTLGHIEEVEMLRRESELPLEDLLKELPDDYLENRDKDVTSEKSGGGDDASSRGDDDEFVASDKDSTDDEATIQEQETVEGKVDHKKELEDLQADNEMSIEDLIAKYGAGGSSTLDADDGQGGEESEDDDDEDEDEDDENGEESESESEDEDASVQSEEADVGLKSLLDDEDENASNEKKAKDNEAAGKEINDVAALAESIQPKGNTLSSTSVVTPIPFLLKHTLREYQHIGLDWLVTMFDRKLNGILADEMGLGKTIQTISLLAHLACEKGNWGPHLIIVPTSVMLNWEMELKKWCPAFKILTYYGSQKERKQKRTGWTKPNAFHVCITSYKLVIQDHQSFRRKKWKYLILDEAQNIKNFKSQRWQLLLNFQTQRRLLLTGTPLQNNLMELWSLMHFLMPNVFQSHREFKEWFSNPVTGMIEGNSEYNEGLIKRLHKVLRPFLLRRLKSEVEKQLPKKYEHIVMCRLSKRQRFLYDDFMSRAKTRETLACGNLLSVINVLMQLRKVCNHPNLFEVRPTISPFQMEGITYETASLVMSALDYDPFRHVDLFSLNLMLVDLEMCLTAFVAHRIKKYRAPKKLIEEIDSAPEPPPRCPPGKIKIHVRLSSQQQQQQQQNSALTAVNRGIPMSVTTARVGTSPLIRTLAPQTSTGQGVTLRVTGGTQLQGYSVQLVQHQGGVKAIPVATLGPTSQVPGQQQQQTLGVQVKQSDGVQRFSVPAGFAQLVQTSTGRHILLTPSTQVLQSPGTATVMTASGHRLTVLPKPVSGVSTTTVTTVNRMTPSSQVTSATLARPVMRVPPLNMTGTVQATLGTLVNTVVAGTTTVTTTTTMTSTKTSTALTQPVLAALVQQSQRNNTSAPITSSIVTRNETKIIEQKKRKQEMQVESQSVFYLPELEEKKRQRRKAKLELLNRLNQRRCAACPIYGSDLIEAMRFVDVLETRPGDWRGAGFAHCMSALKSSNKPDYYWSGTDALRSIVHTPVQYVNELRDIFSRFVLCVSAVNAPQPKFHVSHPPPSKFWAMKRTQAMLQQELSSHSALLHPIASAMVTQFPDPRLIQYDCGKLQVLDRLLRQLKAGHHRVLIFTQMTRMLDVLEAFLNFHGHIYLRLDGTTRVDQRQVLMERFNADRRIFCFILSTRSGGIGVNLTGADTVIFYDSDWNPTMDAQAQDRCHRIGQTRDVHIYRLVSEKTVEENILKKANQKRLLGDLAIEGGNFTTAYFKSSTIQDLFNVDVTENDASRRMAEVLEGDSERERRRQKDESQLPASPNDDKAALGALESALAQAEDESDVQAARTAKAEAAADLAEFDESIPLEDGEAAGGSGEPEMSKAELEVHNLVQQLTPVERYAMKFVEETDAAWSAEQLAAAEAEIEQQKKEWELGRLQALKEEEERRARLTDEDDQLLTFSQEDSHNQVWVSQNAREQMPMWCPPTPPQDDNDVYIDHSMGFLYEQTIMSESQLPVVYVKKDHKRLRLEAMPAAEREGRRPLKMRKEESMYTPRSLFDRPSPALVKMRRDMKLQRCRGGYMRSPSVVPGLKPPSLMKPLAENENVPDWVIHEDWALLQAVRVLLELPLNLTVLSPGHTPNWDMVADMVNNVSRIYRSPKQCRNRYESHIIPREEGKILYDTNPKKQKKTKAMMKLPQQTKTNRPMKTCQLFIQDNNSAYTQLYAQRFEIIKAVSNKRTPTVKPLLVNPTMRNPKHAAVLAGSGITYDQPLTPVEVAMRRAERIAKEKQKTAQAAAAQVLTAEQQLVAQRLQQQQAVAAAAKSASATPAVAQGTTSTTSSPGPSTPSPVPSSTAQAVVVGLSQASPQQIGTVVTTVIQTGSTATSTLNRRPVTTLTVQDMVAAGQVRAVGSSSAVVSVASLTPAQVQVAAQRLATANLVSQAQTAVTAVATKGVVTAGTVTAGGKTLTPAQIQYYKHQQMVRQQQQQRLLREQQLKAIQAQTAAGQGNQKVSVAVTTGTTMGIATVAGVTAVQVSQAQQQQQRAQFIKQTTAGGKQTIEMAALIKRQQQQQLAAQQQQKAGGSQVAQVQVPAQTVLTPAQILAQAGLQVQQAGTSGQTQVATLVKTVTASGSGGTSQSVTIPVTGMTLPQVKATLAPGGIKTATQQQIRQLALHQQLLQQRKQLPQNISKLTQVAGKAGVPAQLIVQSQKPMPTTMTVQQIQQVIKQVQPHIAHVTGAQAGTSGSPVISHGRVIPVSGTQQSLKQTIQVVTASPGVRTSVPNVTIDSAGRPQVSVASTLASTLAGTIKVATSTTAAQQQAILSQVNAVLQQQGQPMSVAVRQTQSPVRIQTSAAGTPLVAVTVQQQSGTVTAVSTQQVLTTQQQATTTSATSQQSSSSQEPPQ